MSADLAFIMLFGLILRAITGQEAYGYSSVNYFRVVIIAPVVAGLPGGIIYGLLRRNLGEVKLSRMRFWLSFWFLSLLLFIIQASIFTFPDTKNIIAAAIGLLFFSWIWAYLMEVIYDNPLTFDHLMPEESNDVEPQSQNYSTALIRKRRD